jgi:hypothetical protein
MRMEKVMNKKKIIRNAGTGMLFSIRKHSPCPRVFLMVYFVLAKVLQIDPADITRICQELTNN